MNSIKTKLILVALLISLVPLFIFGVISLSKTTELLSESIKNNLNTIVRSKESALESFILNTQKTAQAFVSTATVEDYISYFYRDLDEEEVFKFNKAKEEVNDMLYHYMEEHWAVEYHHIFIADITGEVVLSPEHGSDDNKLLSSHLGADISDNPWFNAALKEFQVTDYFTWTETDHYHQLLLLPIKNREGVAMAVMGFELMLDYEHDILVKDFDLGETGKILLATLDGQPVVHFKDKEQPQLDHAGIEEAKVSGFYVGRSINEKGVEVIGFYLKNNRFPWILVAEIETREAFADLRIIALYFYVGLVITAMLVIFLIIILSSLITGPIINLRNTAKDIMSGKTDKRVYIESGDEIGQLADMFNKMTDNLLEAKKRVEVILESIGDGVFVIDVDMNLLMCNKTSKQLVGCGKKTAIGQSYYKFLKFVYEVDNKINDGFIKKCLKDGKIVSTEVSDHTMLIRKNGERLPVDCSAAPVKDGRGDIVGCVVVFHDISAARKIDKMKSEFVSIASHQLRTPLTSIKLFVNMLALEDTERFNKNQLEYINSIKISSDRMVGLVNDLLNVSRLETGQIIIGPEPTSLNDFLSDIVKDVLVRAKEKGSRVVYDKPKNIFPKVNIDPMLLRQVINNLLHNALIYSPEGRGEIKIGLKQEGDNYVFFVSDNGIGIPKEIQSKIFGKFFRSDNAIKTVGDGSGLGLYLAKMIMDSAGGKIWFESEIDKGTTFYVSLPLSGMKAKKGNKGLSS